MSRHRRFRRTVCDSGVRGANLSDHERALQHARLLSAGAPPDICVPFAQRATVIVGGRLVLVDETYKYHLFGNRTGVATTHVRLFWGGVLVAKVERSYERSEWSTRANVLMDKVPEFETFYDRYAAAHPDEEYDVTTYDAYADIREWRKAATRLVAFAAEQGDE